MRKTDNHGAFVRYSHEAATFTLEHITRTMCIINLPVDGAALSPIVLTIHKPRGDIHRNHLGPPRYSHETWRVSWSNIR
jgi:hypothetical protein